MLNYCVSKNALTGTLRIPPSKSQTLRAILFGMLAEGKTEIENPLASPDTEAMITACRHLGAEIKNTQNKIEIQGIAGNIEGAHDVINAGNSGLVFRFITAIAALGTQPIVITGDSSIRNNRPIQPLLRGLSQLGVSAISTRNNGCAPVIIQGPIQSGKVTISGEDSQPISGLLAAGSFAHGPVHLHVNNPGEKPWINLTLQWLTRLGISFAQRDFSYYSLNGHAKCTGFSYSVPGDLSSAAFPIVAALITHSELTLENVDMSDAQGDKQLIYVLQEMGAPIEIDHLNKRLFVGKLKKKLKGIKVDINDFVDSIAALSVIGCFAEGSTYLLNAEIARKKECNRIHCLAKELKKMGADICEMKDGLLIKTSELKGAIVDSHSDHRLAMALTIAGLGASGKTTIQNVDCVAKTFPNFMESFNLLGANIELMQNASMAR